MIAGSFDGDATSSAGADEGWGDAIDWLAGADAGWLTGWLLCACAAPTNNKPLNTKIARMIFSLVAWRDCNRRAKTDRYFMQATFTQMCLTFERAAQDFLDESRTSRVI
jgi:hypothetical protein